MFAYDCWKGVYAYLKDETATEKVKEADEDDSHDDNPHHTDTSAKKGRRELPCHDHTSSFYFTYCLSHLA